MSIVIGIVLAAVIVLGLTIWKPEGRYLKAFKISLWPLVLPAIMGGGPIYRSIIGQESKYLQNASEWLGGSLGLWTLIGIPLFAFGAYLYRPKKSDE